MACMTHVCRKCSWMQFDNSFYDGKCPQCSGEVYSMFDEQNDGGHSRMLDENEALRDLVSSLENGD